MRKQKKKGYESTKELNFQSQEGLAGCSLFLKGAGSAAALLPEETQHNLRVGYGEILTEPGFRR